MAGSDRASTTGYTGRREHGRGHSYLLDGRKVDGVTWVVDNGIPKRALIDWAARATAGYAVDNWEELNAAKPSERMHRLERARFETTRSALARGTTVHGFALRLAAGEEVDVPEAAVGLVDAYLRFVDEWDPQEILVEVPVFNRSCGYAGTLDLIADLADGARWLLDWKTGGKGIFTESALQLAAYRNAEFYLDAEGNENWLPDVDRAGCVWLREDGYDLYPVNAGAATFRLFRYAQQLARWGQEDRENYIGEALAPPARNEAA